MAARAPAWYRDPKNRARLRRWNGSAWTSETRPLPGWVAPGAAAASAHAAVRLRHRARTLWAVSAAFAVSGVAVIPLLARPDDRAPSPLSSSAFVRSANAVCGRARTEGPVAEPARASGPDADRIADLVVRVNGMVSELRTLEVEPADRPAVERWLDDWGRYLAAGERLALALRQGDEAGAGRADVDSAGPKQALDRFAAANGLTGCIL